MCYVRAQGARRAERSRDGGTGFRSSPLSDRNQSAGLLPRARPLTWSAGDMVPVTNVIVVKKQIHAEPTATSVTTRQYKCSRGGHRVTLDDCVVADRRLSADIKSPARWLKKKVRTWKTGIPTTSTLTSRCVSFVSLFLQVYCSF